MLKKSLLAAFLLLNVSVAVNAETGILKPKAAVFFACPFTQTNTALSFTHNEAISYSLTQLSFAVHYSINPYSQGQWEVGVVLGTIPCYPSTYVYGRRTQVDGRVMEAGVTPSGYVVVRWISGPPMPSTGASPYVVSMGSLNISATGG